MPSQHAPRFEPLVHIDEALWRQRLIDRILDAPPASARLTLLNAPAGFGKTTVLAQLAQLRRDAGARVVWLNCDDRDKDPSLFIESLEDALACSQPGGPLPPAGGASALVRSLAHRLGDSDTPVLLCIDEYEAASGTAVDEIVEQIARAAPPHLDIVLASREAPARPLTRLQLAGFARLIDADWLRFTREETLYLLAGTLPERAALQVAAYVDGWPFALQLARLRAAGGAGASDWAVDVRAKIPRRQIFDYLADEFIASLPPSVVEFLGDVSVLERIDVAAANALREREDSLTLIRQLTRLRPIVVVDETPWSARLHPLLRDYLIDAVDTASPGRIASLHLRAARHLAGKGLLHEAVTHAVAGGRLDLAAGIIEDAGAIRLIANEGALRSRLLLQQLPEATLRKRPRLRLLHFAQQVVEDNPAKVESEFERIERQLRDADTGPDDPARFDLEFGRCVLLLSQAEHHLHFSPWATLAHATSLARAHAAEDSRLLGCTLPLEIFFLHRYGPVDRCERRTREVESVHAQGAYTYNSPWIWMYHARNALARGDLAQSEHRIRQSLHLDVNFINYRQDSLGQLVNALLGRIAYLRGALVEAQGHFGAISANGPPTLLETHVANQVDAASCEFALGHDTRALEMLDVARDLAFEENLPHLGLVAGAVQLELLLRLGHEERARKLADLLDIEALWSMAEQPFALPWVAVESLARARGALQLATGDAAAAEATGQSLLSLAQRSGHRLGELQAELLIARAHAAASQTAPALAALGRALAQGAASGATQAFMDGGAELMALLRGWLSGPPAAEADELLRLWARHLLAHWEATFRSRAQAASHGAGSALTPRELDVLCELAKNHPTKLIARDLMLSPETVKHHLKSIFAKLAVRSREDAVAAARRLALMP